MSINRIYDGLRLRQGSGLVLAYLVMRGLPSIKIKESENEPEISLSRP